mgnify:FL=1
MTASQVRGCAGVATALVLAFGLPACSARPEAETQSSPASEAPQETSQESPQESPPAATYADGKYQATGWYGGLPSHIEVTLTLESDVITAVSVVPAATNLTSLDLQERFAEVIPAVVIGRRIADLEVGKIAGSSGTPVGFNDALDQIRTQAATDAAPHSTP